MTSKYYDGLAGIREVREKRCILCIHAKPDEAFTQIACSCEESDHFCHILVAWHPACEQYGQGIMPLKDPDKTVGANNHSPEKRGRGRPKGSKNKKTTYNPQPTTNANGESYDL